MQNKRLPSIDVLRSIAIIIMIIANSCPYILVSPHSIWLRIISSLAAPLFIFLSGYSFFISINNKINYRHKLLQVFYLIISALFIDIVIWQTVPFQTFDVLYMISFGLLINILILKLKVSLKLLLAITCICSSFLLQNIFNYRFNIPDIQLQNTNCAQFNWFSIFEFRRCFIDGWFPLFPWLGIAILGQVIAQESDLIFKHKNLVKWSSLFLFLIFGIILINKELVSPEREGYLELFYPPSLFFIFFELSFILLLFSQVYNLKCINSPKLKFLGLVGRKSLFIYIFHTFVISFLFQNYFSHQTPVLFSAITLLFLFCCYLLTFIVESLEIKNNLKFIPVPLKAILGLK